MGEAKLDADLNQFGSIIDGIAKKCGSLKDIGINPEAFKASLTAWMARYNAKVIFCRQETSGTLIKEILFRELKERLERGEYG